MKEEQFESFIRSRFENNDWSEYLSIDRSSLSRKRIFEACQLSRSSLYQNQKIKNRLSEVESFLRHTSVLIHSQMSVVAEPLQPLVFTDKAAKILTRLDALQIRMAEVRASFEDVRNYISNLEDN